MSNFTNFDFYLLRTPRLPSKTVQEINGFDSKEEAWDYLMDLLKDQEILDSIYIASVPLFNEILLNLKNPYSPSGDKLLMSLIKYVNRMAGRATPYGKFSGISFGKVESTSSNIKLSGDYCPTFRLDTEYLAHLINLVLKENSVKDQLLYYTNSTQFETKDRYYYIDFNENNYKSHYTWAWVANNPILQQVLLLGEKGVKLSELATYLNRSGVDQERAENYLYKLLDLNLLINELEVSRIHNKAERILPKLRNLELPIPIRSLLDKLNDLLQNLNSGKTTLHESLTGKDIIDFGHGDRQHMFQTDLKVETKSNIINRKILHDLAQELEELSVLNRGKTSSQLKSFYSKFQERYGERAIPLLEVLDPGRGIGYGSTSISVSEHSPLLFGLGMPNAIQENNSDSNRLTQSIVDRILLGSIDTTPIDLNPNELQSLKSQGVDNELPAAFYALGNVLTFDRGLDNGDYFFNLQAVGGASSIPLMSRFCHLDAELEEQLKKCAKWEEEQMQNIILAEIVCLPDTKAGNILSRPSLFKYEIPIVGQCSVEKDFCINLDDLLVSIKEKKVILHSKRLGKQVIPRLSSAHNFHYQMVIYRFLCDLQFQYGYFDLTWDWGVLASSPFTPRITYKHIILARAKWNITKKSIDLSNIDDDKMKVSLLKKRFNLPDIISLTNGDNELIIDLRNSLSAGILLKQLEKTDIVLHEYLFQSYDSPVIGVDGEQYNNEIIIPFKVKALQKMISLKPRSESKVKRSFLPGTEWAYIKIYCNVMEGERLMSNQIRSLLHDLEKKNIIDKWFFIRYFDPDSHIRLRFRLKENNGEIGFQQLSICINHHLSKLLENRLIHRIVYDTYERELERYGMDNIEIFESIFHLDSQCVLRLLPLFKQGHGRHFRWLTGMLGVDHLFTAFGLDLSKKISLTTSLRDAFFNEFNTYNKLKFKLDRKYRENRSWVDKFFDLQYEDAQTINNILQERLKTMEQTVDRLNCIRTDQEEWFGLLSSLTHMYINRLFLINQRENEMVIYHFLTKFYTSSIKRTKLDCRQRVVRNNPFNLYP